MRRSRLIAARVLGGVGAAVPAIPSLSSILINTYGASEVWPLVDISSGTVVTAKVSAAYNGTLTGWDLRNAAGPVTGTLAPYSDGLNDVGNIINIASVWNGGIGAMSIFGKASAAADWSDGLSTYLCSYKYDNSNWINLLKHGTLGIRASITIGGVAKIITLGIPAANTDWFMATVTWKDSANGNEAKAFLNGVQGGSTQTGFGAWTGTPTIVTIGSASTTPANVFKGWLAYHAVKFGVIWTPTEIANMYAARLTAGPEA